MSKRYACILGVALAGAVGTTAQAENLLDTTVARAQTCNGGTCQFAVFESGSFTQTFFTGQAETVMLSFSAVCSVSGTGLQAAKIKVFVSNMQSGTVAYPTGNGSFSLCSAAGAARITDARGSYSFVTGVPVNAGFHNVTLQVTPTAGGVAELSSLGIQVWN